MKRNNNGSGSKSFSVALCGVCAALAMLLMFSTSIMPILDYTMPAAAGILLAVIVIEVNKKWAVTAYAAISILSFITVPSKEATLLFALFLGYYPILKSVLEKIKNKALCWSVKYVCFNAAVVLYYKLLMVLFTAEEAAQEALELGKYGIWVLLAAANVVFAIYDVALTRLISMYYNWIRKKFLRR